MAAQLHQCYQCGMSYPANEKTCPKCDFGRYEQNKGKQTTVDVAHNLQTVDQATQQFYSALADAKRQNYSTLRVIVGGGLINREIGRVLETELWKKQIRSFEKEPYNQGAYLVRL